MARSQKLPKPKGWKRRSPWARKKRIRKRQWVGSPEDSRAVLALFVPYLFVSFYRHDEPFNKRDRSRRRKRQEKQSQRAEALRIFNDHFDAMEDHWDSLGPNK